MLDYFRRLKEKHTFNAMNCRAKMQVADNAKRDAKISEITDRIKFVTNYNPGETTVIFRVDDDADLYNTVERHFSSLGFAVIRKDIEELNETYMLISWKP
jgi:hypothetical protein